MECIDLMFNAFKILAIYYSYDKNFENQEIFINLVLKIKELLRLWRMRNLTIAGKITVFKNSCNIENSTPCNSKDNSNFSYF